jgi:hypothetical protein
MLWYRLGILKSIGCDVAVPWRVGDGALISELQEIKALKRGAD